MASYNDAAKRTPDSLTEHIPVMMEELHGIRDACNQVAGELGTSWRADEAILIEEIIEKGSAHQMYDAIEVLTSGNHVGEISVLELRKVLGREQLD